jgi:TetR/AcrR family transcriptional repressor of bet genes
MGRPSNTAERRRDIVRGLRLVLAENGYAGATVPDIARAARLSPGLVHYHFDSKRAVLLALVDDLTDGLRARFADRAAAAKTARDRLRAFVDAATALGADADEDAVACWIGIVAEAVRDADVRDVVERTSATLRADLAQLTSDALAEAGRDRRDAPRIALLLWTTIQGSYLVAKTSPSAIPRGAMAAFLRRLVDDSVEEKPR